MSQSERRLAAIMFTDIVGYSALTQENEALALQLLEEHRSVVRPLLAKHHGREIQTIGDAFFVEFSSALSAVQCAIEMQKELTSHSSSSLELPERFLIRIGIHLGDVEERDGDVLGDGVNIASRIESLAMPGGICVSEDVARQVRNKISLKLESKGHPKLKNISESIEVFQVETPWLETQDEPGSNGREGEEALAKSIAVLPFTNNSPDPENAYFSDGLTDELIYALTNVEGLRVTSRTSTFAFRDQGESLREIGKKLKVGNILEGSVRKSGEKIRISAQLVDVRKDALLWSDSYDLVLDDIFELQTQLSEQVAQSLKLELLHGVEPERPQHQPKDIEAYTEYLKGRFFWNKRTHKDLLAGIEHFEQALAKDPEYALAYAGIADCYTALALLEFLPPKDAFPKAKEAAKKALEIENLAEAHASLGLVLFQYDWDWTESEKELKESIRLRSNYPTARHYYADLLKARSEFDEALAEMEHAKSLDPLSLVINLGVGHVLYLSQRYHEAIAQYQHTLELDPEFVMTRLWFGRPYLQKEMYPEAIAEIEQAVKLSPNGIMAQAVLGHALASAGRSDEVEPILDDLITRSKKEYVPSYWVAMIYIGMGNFDCAFEWLNRAVEERSSWLAWIKVEPRFEGLRSDPRFDELIAKMGLEG